MRHKKTALKKERELKEYKEKQRQESAAALEQARYSRAQHAELSKAAYKERKLWRKLGAIVPAGTTKKIETQFSWKVLAAKELDSLGAEYSFSGKGRKIFTNKTSAALTDLAYTLEIEIVLQEIEVFEPVKKNLKHVPKTKVSVEDAYSKLAEIWS